MDINWESTTRELKIAALKAQIEDAKETLAATDYKAIKNAEYAAIGLPLEYDPESLYEERQALRDQINTWESELSELIS